MLDGKEKSHSKFLFATDLKCRHPGERQKFVVVLARSSSCRHTFRKSRMDDVVIDSDPHKRYQGCPLKALGMRRGEQIPNLICYGRHPHITTKLSSKVDMSQKGAPHKHQLEGWPG